MNWRDYTTFIQPQCLIIDWFLTESKSTYYGFIQQQALLSTCYEPGTLLHVFTSYLLSTAYIHHIFIGECAPSFPRLHVSCKMFNPLSSLSGESFIGILGRFYHCLVILGY